MSERNGILKIVISAIIFGVTPILTALTYRYGNNGLNMAFFRNLLCVPVLYAVVKSRKLSIALTLKQFFSIVIAAVFGSAATTVLLYSSYSYVSSGIATILHFTYPAFTILFAMTFFKRAIKRRQLLSVIISIIGLVCFIDFKATGSLFGIVLAILSGATYAFYIVWIQKTRLVDFSPFVLSFYLALFSSAFILLLNPINHFLVVDLSINTWLLIVGIALSTSFIATALLQDGLKVIDGTTASLISLLEPTIGFALGILIEDERMAVIKFVGFALILSSILMTVSHRKMKKR